jgi:hypothetical protein
MEANLCIFRKTKVMRVSKGPNFTRNLEKPEVDLTADMLVR